MYQVHLNETFFFVFPLLFFSRHVFAAEQLYENLDNQQGGNLSRTVMGIRLIIRLDDDVRKA
jgi:hypothetical protein